MDDEHVEGWTGDYYCDAPVNGFYFPDIVLKYIPGKYIVVKSGVSDITNGDEIISVNGLTTKQWEDSLQPYLSVGDSASFHYEMETSIMQDAYGDPITITYYNSLNNMQTISTYCTSYLPYQSYYPNDTLANIQWRYWSNCNIGYINVGNM
jgi:hypothetical protein